MGWRVAEHLTIYREAGWYGAHPNVVRTPKGDLLTLFHRSPATGFSHHSHPLFDVRACRSSDEGQTWGTAELVTVYPHGGVIDFGTHTLSGGEIFLHASTVDLVLAQTPEISKHTWISRPGVGFHVRSSDNGRTWSPWRSTTMRGCPGHLLGLRDGRVLATVGTRWEGQMGCLARVLDPETGDLNAAPDIVVRADSLLSDCGYPWSVELMDGRVLVVYYFVYGDGTRGIEGSVLEEY